MLAHYIKPILSLVPGAQGFIKSASVDQDLPIDNRDSCIASALELKYHECVDHSSVDLDRMEKVAEAVRLYGVQDIVSKLSGELIKAAKHRTSMEGVGTADEYLLKQAYFEGSFNAYPDYSAISDEACRLYKQASALGVDPSDVVKRYSGHVLLDKKASIEALATRFHLTNNPNFVKIAQAIHKLDEFSLKPETITDICRTVSEMDKEAAISATGYNFFQEATLLKSAASVLTITLRGKEYPYESIQKLGKDRISQYIGKDIADEMDKGPMNTKQVMETLPADLQQVLCNLLKNV